MTRKKSRSKLEEIEEALKAFPKMIREQEKALREEKKILKRFGSLVLEPIEKQTRVAGKKRK